MFTINDSIILQKPSPFDAKSCNWYMAGDDVIIETIRQFLDRVVLHMRSPNVAVNMLIPTEGYESLGTYPESDFSTIQANFDGVEYAFIGGLEDENFVPRPGDHPAVTIADESADKLAIDANQVLSIIPDPELHDGRISGGDVSWLENYDYSVSASIYRYLGLISVAQSSTVTLDASDVTNPRIDVIALTFGVGFEVLTGIAAVDPVKPQIDPLTQVELTHILVPANSTEPADVTDELVFDENEEWTPSTGTVTVDFDSTTAPFHGSKCADVGTIANNNTITFTASAPLTLADYETLSFFLKLKAIASTKNAVYVRFQLAGVAVSQEIAITWSLIDITNWQGIVMLFSDFTFTGATFDSVRIRWSRVQGTNTHPGFYLDYINLQAGVVQNPVFVDTVELTGDVIAKGKTGTPIPSVLKNIITAGTLGTAAKTVTITWDAKGRITAVTENDITITDGREIELSTSGLYIVWRYVGAGSWTNLCLIPEDGAPGTAGRGIVSIVLTNTVGLVKTYTITYTDATTLTFDVTDGASGETDVFQVHINFEVAEAETYVCPYACKFTAMIRQQVNAPTLSVALNTNMAQYDDLIITPDAVGLVTLTGVWL